VVSSNIAWLALEKWGSFYPRLYASTVSVFMQLAFSLSYTAICIRFAFDVTYANVAYATVKSDGCFICFANNSGPFSSFLCLLFCHVSYLWVHIKYLPVVSSVNQLCTELKLSHLTASFKRHLKAFLFCSLEQLIKYSEMYPRSNYVVKETTQALCW